MKVKEIFYSIQGEGRNSGRAAVFCRFTGCNLACEWCDTDFVGGTDYTEDELVLAIEQEAYCCRFVVFTGGEPALQLTASLILKIRQRGFDVAVESNGTIRLPEGDFWKTISPKEGKPLKQISGNELKVVWPQNLNLTQLQMLNFRYFYLQPMDGNSEAMRLTVARVLKNPFWKLSLQTHKYAGIR